MAPAAERLSRVPSEIAAAVRTPSSSGTRAPVISRRFGSNETPYTAPSSVAYIRWPVFTYHPRLAPWTNTSISPDSMSSTARSCAAHPDEHDWNSTALPPGSTAGQNAGLGPGGRIWSGTPPAPFTRDSVNPADPYTMNPSSPHEPPAKSFWASSARVMGGPPVTGTFFRLSSASVKNATHSPSGEKNGAMASSVPESAIPSI